MTAYLSERSISTVFNLFVDTLSGVVNYLRGAAGRWLMYTAVLDLVYSSFRWCRWVIVGCHNWSRYKKVDNHCSRYKGDIPEDEVDSRAKGVVDVELWVVCLLQPLALQQLMIHRPTVIDLGRYCDS